MRKLLVFLWLGTWLYLCLIPALESRTGAYLAWQSEGCPGYALGTPACPAEHAPLQRGLVLWIVTSPLLAWAMNRSLRTWSGKYSRWGWNGEKTFFSLASLIALALVTASIWVGASRVPYPTSRELSVVATLLVLLSGWLYRAALLSAPTVRPS